MVWTRKGYSFIKRNLEGPQDHKDVKKAEIPSPFKLHDNFIDQEGWLPPLKKQYFAKFSDLSDVHVISESFGHAPVSPHVESIEGGLSGVGAHGTDTQVSEGIIKIKDGKLVELSWIH